jgi:hypothetical protein
MTTGPAQERSELVACPLCGDPGGYRLQEGDTYRWWLVRCGACAELVAECRSDRRTDKGSALPKRWPAADDAWNEAGRHAQGLRDLLGEWIDLGYSRERDARTAAMLGRPPSACAK